MAVDKPTMKRVGVIVTDTEWRAIRIAAAGADTSVQGYVTGAVLRRLQKDDPAALRAARKPSTK
jgi:F420-0:gamma-glutamyl ligase